MHEAGTIGGADWCFTFCFPLKACTQMWGFVMRFNVVTPKLSGVWPPRLVLTTSKRGAAPQEWNSPLVSSRLRNTWTESQHPLQKEMNEMLLTVTTCYELSEGKGTCTLLIQWDLALVQPSSSLSYQPWKFSRPSAWVVHTWSIGRFFFRPQEGLRAGNKHEKVP